MELVIVILLIVALVCALISFTNVPAGFPWLNLAVALTIIALILGRVS